MVRTRRGIYLDLTKSVYKLKTPDTQLTFIFSSDLHLTKFEEQYKAHRIEHNLKLKARYKLDIRSTVFADLVLYTKVESRGFLVINDRGQNLCHENLILDGEKATRKS